MRSTRRNIRLCLFILAACGTLDRAPAQVVYVFQPEVGVHDWNDPNNWLGDDTFVFVPDIDQAPGDSALLNTEATAQISDPAPRIGQLLVDGGAVLIDDDGSLETAVSNGTTGAAIPPGPTPDSRFATAVRSPWRRPSPAWDNSTSTDPTRQSASTAIY